MDTLFDLPANTDPAVYVDPFPGRKGDELVEDTCGRCLGDKRYHGASSYTWNRKGTVDAWCFTCNGKGTVSIKVSSVRARARRDAKAAVVAAQAELDRPVLEWLAAEKEFKAEQAKVAAEAARVAELVQGFVAEVGEKIKNLSATVTYAGTFEVPSYSGYGTDYKALVILTADDGKVIKAAGTGASLYDLKKGQKVTVSGTVKDHGEFKGQDQTILTRAKIAQQ